MFVKDAANKEIVNLALAMRIGCRHHHRDDLWQVYAEFGFDRHVVIFEDESREKCKVHLARIEALLRERETFLY